MSIHLSTNWVLGADIGGSHVSSALVNVHNGEIWQESYCKEAIDAAAGKDVVTTKWINAFLFSLTRVPPDLIAGIGIAMPGPFDYVNGISLIKGVNKYESLYGLDVKELLKGRLNSYGTLPACFENDAACFALGENLYGKAAGFRRVLAITLGTGLGAAFLVNYEVQKQGEGIPPEGYLYNVPFKEGIAEDYISSHWLINNYNKTGEKKVSNVKELYELAVSGKDNKALALFTEYGENLAGCLLPWIQSFRADCLVIGGSIAKASSFFLSAVLNTFLKNHIDIPVKVSSKTELAAIKGAAALLSKIEAPFADKPAYPTFPAWRKTSQPLMSIRSEGLESPPGGYNMYPFTSLGADSIFSGIDSLAAWISEQKMVLIDGFAGVDWKKIQEQLDAIFREKDLSVCWHETSRFEKDERETEQMVLPFLGMEDSVWGKRTTLTLSDFFQVDAWQQLQPDESYNINIIIGVGAALSHWDVPVIYVDLPKNELQYRMRAKTVCNLGSAQPGVLSAMYKRFYFVDWVVLKEHLRKIESRIAVIADGQWKNEITWIKHEELKRGLRYIAQNNIRVRPWFEPGAWGGQWMKEHIQHLNKEEVNYAWSFELIVPENGLVFESGGWLLEVAFDWLMLHNSTLVLGKDEPRFGKEFPIRFDFLDTIDGGNLSVQCHPRLSYIREQFGETITQDETYYILECKENAKVYLGFQEDIDPAAFREALEKSNEENIPVPIEKYVQCHPSQKHDLFLIPNGTVHSSGANNLVLEISATPYIFTFKMYDWLRLDLNGEPRPINIEHAFRNLDFERKGKKVQQELIARSYIFEKGDNWQIVHLPTHQEHFYDVHRLEFCETIHIETREQCHILMLVEGASVRLETASGFVQRYNYAETFVIPAAAGSYILINEGTGTAKVVKAFVK